MLVTKAYREQEKLKNVRVYKFSLIRIRFPDGIILQGTFAVNETYSAILAFIREHLLSSDVPFILKSPTGTKLSADDEEKTLSELKLVPAVILVFSWNIDDASNTPSQYLKNDTLQLIQNLWNVSTILIAKNQWNLSVFWRIDARRKFPLNVSTCCTFALFKVHSLTFYNNCFPDNVIFVFVHAFVNKLFRLCIKLWHLMHHCLWILFRFLVFLLLHYTHCVVHNIYLWDYSLVTFLFLCLYKFHLILYMFFMYFNESLLMWSISPAI